MVCQVLTALQSTPDLDLSASMCGYFKQHISKSMGLDLHHHLYTSMRQHFTLATYLLWHVISSGNIGTQLTVSLQGGVGVGLVQGLE